MQPDNCKPSTPITPVTPLNIPETNILVPNSTGGFVIKPTNKNSKSGITTATTSTTGGTSGGTGGTGSGGTGGTGGTGSDGTGGTGGGSSIFKTGDKKENIEENKSNKDVKPIKNASGTLIPPESQHAKTHGKPIPCAEDSGDCKPSPMYPFNKVEETQSGHIFEKDDTPGSERLSVSHRTGTYFELLPFGSFNATVVRDAWLSVYRDANLHVDGYTNITLDKGLKIVVNKDKIPNTEEKKVNFDLFVSGDSNINIMLEGGNANVRIHNGDVNLLMENGDVNIRQEKGNYNHYVNGDYNLQVTGHMHTVVDGDSVTEIGGFRDCVVKGSIDHLEVQNGDLVIDVLKGNEKLYVSENRYEHIMGNSKLYCGKTINIFSNQNTSIECDNFQVLTKTNIDLYSLNQIKLYSEKSQNFYSNTTLEIYSIKTINVLSESDQIIQTAVKGIHLNGPRAKLALQASRAVVDTKTPAISKTKWTPTKSRKRKNHG